MLWMKKNFENNAELFYDVTNLFNNSIPINLKKENYVNFKAGNKPRRQIELKLKQKGVDADIISRVCDEFYEDNSDIELEQAKAFVEKKHIDIENADYKELQKVKAALYRRGFSMDIINKTLDSKGLFLDIIDN